MSHHPPNYRQLFSLLRTLGFQERTLDGEAGTRVFLHQATDVLLAFQRGGETLVTAADLLSTEVHLRSKGIAEESLESLLTQGVTR